MSTFSLTFNLLIGLCVSYIGLHVEVTCNLFVLFTFVFTLRLENSALSTGRPTLRSGPVRLPPALHPGTHTVTHC